MQITNPLFYFVLMTFFCFLGLVLSRLTGWGTGLQKKSSGDYYMAVDGLRGLLAISVFFHHSVITRHYLQTGEWVPPSSNFYAQLGPFPVTMFFFVTGFLFWSRLVKSPDSLPLRRFLTNRLRRLMPAYLGSLAAIFLFTALHSNLALLVPIKTLAIQAADWALCGVPFGFTMLNGFAAKRVNASVFWSLRVEWAFYLALPFLGWFATKRRVVWLFLSAAAILCAFWAAALRLPNFAVTVLDLPHQLAFFMVSCFSVGILAAHLKAELKLERLLRHPACTVIAGMLICLVLFFVPAQYGLLESLLLAPIFLMIAFGNDFHGLLTSRPFSYLGAISYSVYLWHGIVLYTVTRSAGRYTDLTALSPLAYWATMATAGVIVILVSSVSYRFLELPYLHSASPKKIPSASHPERVSAASASRSEP
jgi:peptidoglycan/LPS O-acetylase OafA/YrhL